MSGAGGAAYVAFSCVFCLLACFPGQSVIITGESGAGKSEACKLVLQFIADLSAAHSGRTVSEDESSLEQQLLQVGCAGGTGPEICCGAARWRCLLVLPNVS